MLSQPEIQFFQPVDRVTQILNNRVSVSDELSAFTVLLHGSVQFEPIFVCIFHSFY